MCVPQKPIINFPPIRKVQVRRLLKVLTNHDWKEKIILSLFVNSGLSRGLLLVCENWKNEKLLWSSWHSNLTIHEFDKDNIFHWTDVHLTKVAWRPGNLYKIYFTCFSHLPWLIKWRPIKLMAKQRLRIRAFPFSSSATAHKFSIYLHQRKSLKWKKGSSKEMKSERNKANRKMRMKFSRREEIFHLKTRTGVCYLRHIKDYLEFTISDLNQLNYDQRSSQFHIYIHLPISCESRTYSEKKLKFVEKLGKWETCSFVVFHCSNEWELIFTFSHFPPFSSFYILYVSFPTF